MLLSQDRLSHTPVMSLQTGAELAKVRRVLIDPRNLSVLAYELEGSNLDEMPSFLRVEDIRELSNLGFIVDSSDEFVGLDDVIKIKQVHEFEFDLIGIPVIDDRRSTLGKVHGYTVDSDGYAVQQLNVKRPLLKSFSDTELLIHRAQILEVSSERILVKSTKLHEPVRTTLKEYTNPFRQQSQPESIKRQ